ncbi:MAG: hypothetical protein MI744_14345, partial [Pseudomonadales bacterium]|nr:hypothetical protein [Pseudomonadales bacterium]
MPRKRIAIEVSPDSVSPEVLTQLKKLWPIGNKTRFGNIYVDLIAGQPEIDKMVTILREAGLRPSGSAEPTGHDTYGYYEYLERDRPPIESTKHHTIGTMGFSMEDRRGNGDVSRTRDGICMIDLERYPKCLG